MAEHAHKDTISSLRFLSGAFILCMLFVFLLLRTWRKWPDILIDFGRELYLPWRISEGEVLYRDLSHLFGPLSVYYHAALFSLFGASYRVVIVSNLVLFAAFLVFLYSFTQKASDHLSAFTSCFFAISLFSSSQFVFVGNYNFMSPYSHEATHGVILSFLTIYSLWLYHSRRVRLYATIAGLLFGLAYLTKLEILIGMLFTFSVLPMIYVFGRKKDWKREVGSVLMFILGACLPLFAFFTYFCIKMGFIKAMEAINAAWMVTFGSGIERNIFYLRGAGLLKPKDNALRLLLHTVFFSEGVLALLLACQTTKFGKSRLMGQSLWVVVTLFLGLIAALHIDAYNVAYCLPLVATLSWLFLFYLYCRLSQKGDQQGSKAVGLLLWGAYSIGLSMKMVLNSRCYHYGFYLSLPMVTTIVPVVIHYIPKFLCGNEGTNRLRFSVVFLIILMASKCVLISDRVYRAKTFSIGTGKDLIITFAPAVDIRGPIVSLALDWIEKHVDPRQTLAVIPEGVMINYLSRRKNPTGYTSLIVPEVLVYGENSILEAFKKKPPDFILVVHRDTSEYGKPYFGQEPDYGRQIMEWLRAAYVRGPLLGKEPLEGESFGIRIWVKRLYAAPKGGRDPVRMEGLF